MNTTLRARPTPDGIEIVALTVARRSGSRVEVVVTCSAGCRRQVEARAQHGRSSPRCAAVGLRAGTKLDIRVTRRGYFGAFVRYTVLAGNFTKTERCMNPGSRKLRRRCG